MVFSRVNNIGVRKLISTFASLSLGGTVSSGCIFKEKSPAFLVVCHRPEVRFPWVLVYVLLMVLGYVATHTTR